MIAKAKSISHGINDISYITGESRNKKHPERIFHVKDNLLPPGLDATGIWDSMRLTLDKFKKIKNSVIRIEVSPAPVSYTHLSGRLHRMAVTVKYGYIKLNLQFLNKR